MESGSPNGRRNRKSGRRVSVDFPKDPSKITGLGKRVSELMLKARPGVVFEYSNILTDTFRN
jgi:hypothetical protein